MSRDECLERLASCSVGRVAFTAQALPTVRPVTYTMMGNKILFRTAADGALARACRRSVVAFEVDDVRPEASDAWSVLVVGIAEPLEGSAALRAVETGLATHAGGRRDLFIAVTLGQVSGRHVRLDGTRDGLEATVGPPA